MSLKLDYKRTFLLGFGFLGVSVLWLLYNTYVPVFLQAGNPAFDATSGATTVGFGLSAVLAGFIMTLDNIAAFFIQPLVGILSDRTRTRIGRRMPYILAGAPIAATTFTVIPVAVSRIPPELSGQTSQLGGPLAFFMIVIGVMLLAMAFFRTPLIALMPDITPSPLRSKANGVINMMGGIGGLLATFGGAVLYRIDQVLAFAVGALILLVAVAVVFVYIKERPAEAGAGRDKKEQWWDTLRQAGAIPHAAFLPYVGAIAGLLFLGGIAWSLININSLPMIVDLAPGDHMLGIYTGPYYISGTLAAIVGPILNGWIIELTNKNYSSIFLVAPAFMVVSMICMWFLTRGEAHASPAA